MNVMRMTLIPASGEMHMDFDASRDGLRFIRHFLGERWVL